MKTTKIAGIFLFLLCATMTQAIAAMTFTIHGNFVGLADGTVLELIPSGTHNREKALASTTVTAGQFNFKGTLDGPRFFQITAKGHYGGCQLMIENTNVRIQAKASLTTNYGNKYLMLKDIQISGSPIHDLYLAKIAPKEALSNDYEAYNKRGEVIYKQVQQAYKEKDSVKIDSLKKTPAYKQFEEEESAFYNKVSKVSNDLIESNKDSWWGPFMMLNTMSYFTPEQKPLFELLSVAAKKSYYGQLVHEELFPKGFLGVKAPLVDAKAQDNNKADIAKLTEGHKYTLVDFWASWCAPCRKALPALKELYKEFSSKGLQVVSISIDKKESDWTKAEAEEQLKWPSFLDNGNTANAWKVKAIPALFLLDEKGKVVGENLTLDQVRSKLNN